MKNTENIEQLLARFMSQADSAAAAEDIRTGDSFFDTHRAPTPGERTIASIQLRVRAELTRQRTRRFAQAFSAAAVVLLALSAGLFWMTSQKPQNRVTEPTYAAVRGVDLVNEIRLHDALVSAMETELTDVANSMNDLRKDIPEDSGSLSIDLMELEELELLASNTDFWKG